jgi:hypothetical protein
MGGYVSCSQERSELPPRMIEADRRREVQRGDG